MKDSQISIKRIGKKDTDFNVSIVGSRVTVIKGLIHAMNEQPEFKSMAKEAIDSIESKNPVEMKDNKDDLLFNIKITGKEVDGRTGLDITKQLVGSKSEIIHALAHVLKKDDDLLSITSGASAEAIEQTHPIIKALANLANHQ